MSKSRERLFRHDSFRDERRDDEEDFELYELYGVDVPLTGRRSDATQRMSPGKLARTHTLALRRERALRVRGGVGDWRAHGAPIQRKTALGASDHRATLEPTLVQRLADLAFLDTAAELPYFDQIQQSFGQFDISGIKAHSGPKAALAARALGAVAFASGTSVAFAGPPDLFTVAHEAAHIVQQRRGLVPLAHVDRHSDGFEQHADRVAAMVVRGESAEALLTDLNAASGVSARIPPSSVRGPMGAHGRRGDDEFGGVLPKDTPRDQTARIATGQGRAISQSMPVQRLFNHKAISGGLRQLPDANTLLDVLPDELANKLEQLLGPVAKLPSSIRSIIAQGQPRALQQALGQLAPPELAQILEAVGTFDRLEQLIGQVAQLPDEMRTAVASGNTDGLSTPGSPQSLEQTDDRGTAESRAQARNNHKDVASARSPLAELPQLNAQASAAAGVSAPMERAFEQATGLMRQAEAAIGNLSLEGPLIQAMAAMDQVSARLPQLVEEARATIDRAVAQASAGSTSGIASGTPDAGERNAAQAPGVGPASDDVGRSAVSQTLGATAPNASVEPFASDGALQSQLAGELASLPRQLLERVQGLTALPQQLLGNVENLMQTPEGALNHLEDLSSTPARINSEISSLSNAPEQLFDQASELANAPRQIPGQIESEVAAPTVPQVARPGERSDGGDNIASVDVIRSMTDAADLVARATDKQMPGREGGLGQLVQQALPASLAQASDVLERVSAPATEIAGAITGSIGQALDGLGVANPLTDVASAVRHLDPSGLPVNASEQLSEPLAAAADDVEKVFTSLPKEPTEVVTLIDAIRSTAKVGAHPAPLVERSVVRDRRASESARPSTADLRGGAAEPLTPPPSSVPDTVRVSLPAIPSSADTAGLELAPVMQQPNIDASGRGQSAPAPEVPSVAGRLKQPTVRSALEAIAPQREQARSLGDSIQNAADQARERVASGTVSSTGQRGNELIATSATTGREAPTQPAVMMRGEPETTARRSNELPTAAKPTASERSSTTSINANTSFERPERITAMPIAASEQAKGPDSSALSGSEIDDSLVAPAATPSSESESVSVEPLPQQSPERATAQPDGQVGASAIAALSATSADVAQSLGQDMTRGRSALEAESATYSQVPEQAAQKRAQVIEPLPAVAETTHGQAAAQAGPVVESGVAHVGSTLTDSSAHVAAASSQKAAERASALERANSVQSPSMPEVPDGYAAKLAAQTALDDRLFAPVQLDAAAMTPAVQSLVLSTASLAESREVPASPVPAALSEPPADVERMAGELTKPAVDGAQAIETSAVAGAERIAQAQPPDLQLKAPPSAGDAGGGNTGGVPSREAAIADIESQVAAQAQAQAPAEASAAADQMRGEYQSTIDQAQETAVDQMETVVAEAQQVQAELDSERPPDIEAAVASVRESENARAQEAAAGAQRAAEGEISSAQSAATAGKSRAEAERNAGVSAAGAEQQTGVAAAEATFAGTAAAAQSAAQAMQDAALSVRNAEQAQAKADSEAASAQAEAESQAEKARVEAENQAERAQARTEHDASVAAERARGQQQQAEIQAKADADVAAREAQGQAQVSAEEATAQAEYRAKLDEAQTAYDAEVERGQAEAAAEQSRAESEAAAARQQAEAERSHGQNLLAKGLSWAGGMVESLLSKAQDILRAAQSMIQGILEAARQAALEALNSLRAVAQGGLEAAKQKIQSLIQQIADAVRNLIEAAAALMREVIQAVAEAINALVQALAELLDTLLNTLQQVLNVLVQALIDAIALINEDLAATLNGTVSRYMDSINQAIDQLQSEIDTVSQNLQSQVQSIADQAKAKVTEVEEQAKAKVDEVEQILHKAVEEAHRRASEVADNVFDAAEQAVNAAFDAAAAAVDAYFDAYVAGIEMAKEGVQAATDAAIAAVNKAVELASIAMDAVVELIPDVLKEAFIDFWNSPWREAIIIGLATVAAIALTAATAGAAAPLSAALIAAMYGGAIAGTTYFGGELAARHSQIDLYESGKGIYVPGNGYITVDPDTGELSMPPGLDENDAQALEWASSNFHIGPDGIEPISHQEIGSAALDEGIEGARKGAVSAAAASLGGAAGEKMGAFLAQTGKVGPFVQTLASNITEGLFDVAGGSIDVGIDTFNAAIAEGKGPLEALGEAALAGRDQFTSPQALTSLLLSSAGGASKSRILKELSEEASRFDQLLYNVGDIGYDTLLDLSSEYTSTLVTEIGAGLASGQTFEEANAAAREKAAETLSVGAIITTGVTTTAGAVAPSGGKRPDGDNSLNNDRGTSNASSGNDTRTRTNAGGLDTTTKSRRAEPVGNSHTLSGGDVNTSSSARQPDTRSETSSVDNPQDVAIDRQPTTFTVPGDNSQFDPITGGRIESEPSPWRASDDPWVGSERVTPPYARPVDSPEPVPAPQGLLPPASPSEQPLLPPASDARSVGDQDSTPEQNSTSESSEVDGRSAAPDEDMPLLSGNNADAEQYIGQGVRHYGFESNSAWREDGTQRPLTYEERKWGIMKAIDDAKTFDISNIGRFGAQDFWDVANLGVNTLATEYWTPDANYAFVDTIINRMLTEGHPTLLIYADVVKGYYLPGSITESEIRQFAEANIFPDGDPRDYIRFMEENGKRPDPWYVPLGQFAGKGPAEIVIDGQPASNEEFKQRLMEGGDYEIAVNPGEDYHIPVNNDPEIFQRVSDPWAGSEQVPPSGARPFDVPESAPAPQGLLPPASPSEQRLLPPASDARSPGDQDSTPARNSTSESSEVDGR